MRKSIVIFLLAMIAGAAFWGLVGTPVSLLDVLWQPFDSLWGTQHDLNLKLLEASENVEPMRMVGRDILKPLGVMRVIRTFEVSESSGTRP